MARSRGSGGIRYRLQYRHTTWTRISTSITIGPSQTGLRGTQLTGSIIYTLVNHQHPQPATHRSQHRKKVYFRNCISWTKSWQGSRFLDKQDQQQDKHPTPPNPSTKCITYEVLGYVSLELQRGALYNHHRKLKLNKHNYLCITKNIASDHASLARLKSSYSSVLISI
jgi:hypothetical protein